MATFHVGIAYLLVTERCIIIIASTIVLGGMFISFWGGCLLLLEGWAISWGTGCKYQPRPYMHRAS